MQKEADGFLTGLVKWDAHLGQRVLDGVSFLVPAFLFSAFAVSPKASDLQNVYIQLTVLLVFLVGSLCRLILGWNRLRSHRFHIGSAVFDITCLYAFLAIIPLAYASSAAISLKAPTANVLFVFIVARIVLFDIRLIIATGLYAAIGWGGLTAWALMDPSSTGITREFLEYTTSSKVLIGAQIEHILSILLVTVVSAAVVNAYQRDGLTGLRKKREFLRAFKQRLSRRAKQGSTALIMVRVPNWHVLATTDKSRADRVFQALTAALLGAPIPVEMAARYEANTIILWKRCADDDMAFRNHLQLLRRVIMDVLTRQHLNAEIGAVRIKGSAEAAVQNVLAATENAGCQTDDIQIFDTEFEFWLREEAELQGRTEQALDNNWLVVLHQPIVDMLTNHIAGTEALLRMQAKDGGFVSPARFIPIMEKNGVIDEAGAHVLDVASRENLQMRQAGLAEDLFVSVNVAPPQIHAWTRLKEAAEMALVRGANLKLEVTESIAAQDENMQERLCSLRGHGAKLAIDDFGTGYSSLERLVDMPFDTVKIDIAFTRKITSPAGFAMIDAIVRMAKAAGKDVIIEGIETAEQQALALKAGVRYGQGFYFGRPSTYQDILAQAGYDRQSRNAQSERIDLSVQQ